MSRSEKGRKYCMPKDVNSGVDTPDICIAPIMCSQFGCRRPGRSPKKFDTKFIPYKDTGNDPGDVKS